MKDNEQEQTPLFDALKNHIDRNVIPFHVPGHKYGNGLREFKKYIGTKAMSMDVNGMDDLDYANNPKGVIYESEKLLAKAFGADNAFFLVNGTTGGVQTMIMSICKPNDKIIIPRNAHRSVFSGMILSGAMPIYVYPEINEKIDSVTNVSFENYKKAIEKNPEAKAVFIINPTYYGMTTDLQKVVEFAHEKNMIVMVDEAHGTHMHFNDKFPISAMDANADICAASMHKTAGSLTQSSILLVKGDRVNKSRVREILNLMQTTSASYLLMSSLDVARKQLATSGKTLLNKTLKLAKDARKQINEIEGLYAFGKEIIDKNGCYEFDETKLVVNCSKLNITGYELEKILREEYNIQIEMSDFSNILAIVSLGDTKENLDSLVNALKDISQKSYILTDKIKYNNKTCKLQHILSPRYAFFSPKKIVNLNESEGKICGGMVMVYPPGIPIICTGEQITQEVIDYLEEIRKQECEIQGAYNPKENTICIIDN